MSSEFTIDDVVEILIKQTKILARMGRTIEDIFKIQEEDSRLEGTTITNLIPMVAGSPVLKIDFVEALHQNIPKNISLDVPLVPVQQLVLKNLGPGVLFYSTNKFLNQLEAASKLSAGETREIHLKKRAIKQLNMVPGTANCDVRLEVLV